MMCKSPQMAGDGTGSCHALQFCGSRLKRLGMPSAVLTPANKQAVLGLADRAFSMNGCFEET